MKLKNISSNETLSTKTSRTKTFREKIQGLINQEKDKGLIIHTRFGIHTFGMNRPIDVLVLDKQNSVVKLKSNLAPNRIFLWNPKHSIVIELPDGTIMQTNTKLGDKIKAS